MTSFNTSRHHAAQQDRMVQKQATPDYLDPVHERRRLFAETRGALLLVHVAASKEAALHARGLYVFGCLADPLCILI